MHRTPSGTSLWTTVCSLQCLSPLRLSQTAVSASLQEKKARWSAYPHLSDGAVTGTLGMG